MYTQNLTSHIKTQTLVNKAMFSGTVKLLDLNDYIKPGEECIVLTKSTKLDQASKAYLNIDGEDLKPDLIKPTTTDKAKININDCLACNGCITSSEAILVEEQSISKFLEQHPKFKRKFVLLSPQSRASIAYHTGLSELEVHIRLTDFFKKLDFDFVDDFTIQIDIVKELEYMQMLNNQIKPQMCSECPGWVCYLEKVLGDKFIPYASSIKTPQLFAAELYKNLLASVYNINYQDVYCMLIGPCFDKKLEAAREEAKLTRAVIDLVLSTDELYRYILESDKNYFDIVYNGETQRMFSSINFITELLQNNNKGLENIYSDCFIPLNAFELFKGFKKMGSSNGYADYVINRIDKDFGILAIEEIIRKNKNFLEINITTKDNKNFQLALVYGFKNIQNLVRQVKTKKCGYDYVEIMACPSGCINGGGQIKSNDPMAKTKLIDDVYTIHDAKKLLNGFELVREFVRRFNENQILTGIEREYMMYKFEAIVNTNVQTINW